MSESRIGVLAPLRHRDFRLLATASLTSLLGDGFFRVAIAVQVYAISNDARALAAVAIAWAGAQTLSLPAGGWASDRFQRRRVMIAADLWRAAAVGAIGVLSVTGTLRVWHLLILGACFGAGNGFFNPASTSLIPDLLPDRQLAQANAFLGVARPAMLWIVGPVVGGVLIDATEPGVAFIVDAASFLVSAPLLAAIATRVRGGVAPGGLRGTLRDVGDGLRYVRRNSWAGLWLLAAAIGTLAFHGPFDVLVPYMLKNDFGFSDGEIARTMALILAAGGAGSITAATYIGQRDLPRRYMTTLYLCEAGSLAGVVGFGLMTQRWHAMLAGLVVWTLFALTEIIWNTTMQRFVPRDRLGRVASLDWMVSVGLALASFALASVLGEAFGARPVLIGSGAIGALALLALMLLPGARSLESAPVTPASRPSSAPADPAPPVLPLPSPADATAPVSRRGRLPPAAKAPHRS